MCIIEIMYHGSSYDFDYFDETKIRAHETDAFYNGFWFSSNKNPLPAWTTLNYLYEVEVTLLNPAPHDVIREVRNGLKADGIYRDESRSFADEIRYRLLDLGYDGVIHDDIPEIDKYLYDLGDEVYFSSVRGTQYMVKHCEDDYCELYYANGEYITGYEDLEDYLSQQDKTYVVFKSEQARIIDKKYIENPY